MRFHGTQPNDASVSCWAGGEDMRGWHVFGFLMMRRVAHTCVRGMYAAFCGRSSDPSSDARDPLHDYPGWKEGREYRTEEGIAVLRRLEHLWQQRAPVSWWTGTTDTAPPNDPRIIETDITLDGGQVAKQTFAYDQYNNKTDTYEYDYGSGVVGALVRHTQSGYLTINNGISYDTVGADALHTIHLRNLPLSESVYDSAGALQAQTQFEYDVYTEGLTASGAVGHDAAFSTAYTTRGNVTAVKRWRPEASGPWGR